MWKWIVGGLAMIVGPILAAWATLIILVMGSWEEICFDRSPWWGPPENPNSTCAGHMYQRHEAGYGWFGPGPK